MHQVQHASGKAKDAKWELANVSTRLGIDEASWMAKVHGGDAANATTKKRTAKQARSDDDADAEYVPPGRKKARHA
ncbi:hypothetical protein ColTof4_14071 [Colletotrichum tofieldiae]|nr:hypothetical protein ColTof3_14708 [Colletotrichum tofieldiae]GKT81648.1 hypothetical protein ColTof4_14071 [Colletotrichum tofieldiae]